MGKKINCSVMMRVAITFSSFLLPLLCFSCSNINIPIPIFGVSKSEGENKKIEVSGNTEKSSGKFYEQKKHDKNRAPEKAENISFILNPGRLEKFFPSQPSEVKLEDGWVIETFYPALVGKLTQEDIEEMGLGDEQSEEEEKNMEEIDKAFFESITKIPEEEVSRFEKKWSVEGLGSFNIPVEMNIYVSYYIYLFTETKYREHFEKWLKRYFKYSDIIRNILRENGLPDDLVFVAMAESGFSNKAVSPMSAVGMWQFIRETAQRYGLRIDFWIDERRDFVKSTQAAVNYLKDLYNMFGNWYLAWAGYNAGERRVERAIDRANGKKDFWHFLVRGLIPKETAGYVPKIIAVALITKNMEKFGFNPDDFWSPPITFEEVSVDKQIDIFTLAKICECSVETILELNPHLRHPVTPPYETVIRIPEGKGEVVRKTLRILDDFAIRYEPILVWGYSALPSETYSRRTQGGWLHITPKRKIPFDDFASVFHIPPERYIYVKNSFSSGRTVKIPIEVWARPYIFYRVRRGETLRSIARKFGVSIASIKSINGLKRNSVYRGQLLKIPVDRTGKYSYSEDNIANRMNEKAKVDIRAKVNTRFIVHRVKRGESLHKISKRYSVSISAIKSYNNIKGSRIYPGQQLYIPVGENN